MICLVARNDKNPSRPLVVNWSLNDSQAELAKADAHAFVLRVSGQIVVAVMAEDRDDAVELSKPKFKMLAS